MHPPPSTMRRHIAGSAPELSTPPGTGTPGDTIQDQGIMHPDMVPYTVHPPGLADLLLLVQPVRKFPDGGN